MEFIIPSSKSGEYLVSRLRRANDIEEETQEIDIRSDDSLITSLQDNDRRVTEEFVRGNAGWMFSLAMRMLRDQALSEDVVQAAFINIFANLSSFDGRSNVKTWMHRIVINQSLMQLRSLRRRKEDPIDTLLPDFDANGCRIEDTWTTFETPETLLQRSQMREHVSERIGQLPDSYRLVLILRDIEELSTAEVAELLDLSQANVKVRLHRARAALKKLLEPLIKGGAL